MAPKIHHKTFDVASPRSRKSDCRGFMIYLQFALNHGYEKRNQGYGII